jgi:hypothetical protein
MDFWKKLQFWKRNKANSLRCRHSELVKEVEKQKIEREQVEANLRRRIIRLEEFIESERRRHRKEIRSIVVAQLFERQIATERIKILENMVIVQARRSE